MLLFAMMLSPYLPGLEFELLGGGAGDGRVSCGLRRVRPPVADPPPGRGVRLTRAAAGPLLESSGSERPVSTVRAGSAGGLAELPCVLGATEPFGLPVDGACANAAVAASNPVKRRTAALRPGWLSFLVVMVSFPLAL
jgi:hypothetical protein